MDEIINNLDVEFDDKDKIDPSKFPHHATSIMVDWVVSHKIAKNREQAGFLLIALSILAISSAMLILYFGSFYTSPEDVQPTLLAPQPGSSSGVVE